MLLAEFYFTVTIQGSLHFVVNMVEIPECILSVNDLAQYLDEYSKLYELN